MKGFNAFSNLHFYLALETEHDRIETDRTEDSLAAPAANRNHGYRITPIVTPAYTYARGPFNLSLDLPLKYLHLRYTDDVRAETFRHDRLYLSPHLSLKYTASPALYFTLGGGLNHATGDILSFLRSPIRRSYNRLDLRSLPAESGPRTTRCFMDTGLRCHPARRVELELTVQNLTNADRYTEIQYVDADRFATTFHLRPLHALLTLKAAF